MKLSTIVSEGGINSLPRATAINHTKRRAVVCVCVCVDKVDHIYECKRSVYIFETSM